MAHYRIPIVQMAEMHPGDGKNHTKEFGPKTRRFLQYLQSEAPAFYNRVLQTAEAHPVLFGNLAEEMLGWADALLGKAAVKTLVDGYMGFVIDVNRSQMEYEKRGRYEVTSHSEASSRVYDNNQFMSEYHWGVYVTTFAWEHHLRIFEFFDSYFASRLKEDKQPLRLMDLGSGSGVWSLMSLKALPGATSTLVDISEASVALCRKLIDVVGLSKRATVMHRDALTFRPSERLDAGISCFLLEHLEDPRALVSNLSEGLKEGAMAFVTTALTAAETDHIYEFRRESEVINLVEDCGFRVLAMLSSDPGLHNPDSIFLPRSMAMVLQKRHGQIW